MSSPLDLFLFENVMSFISLNVAMISALCGLMLWFINWRLEERASKQANVIADMQKSLLYLQGVSKNSAECFVQVVAMSNIQKFICEALMRGEAFTDEKQFKVRSHYIEPMREFSKSLQTLILFTDNPIWKQSAYKQLSENLGDATTLEIMKQLRLLQKQKGYDMDTDLPNAIRDLETRINEALKCSSK